MYVSVLRCRQAIGWPERYRAKRRQISSSLQCTIDSNEMPKQQIHIVTIISKAVVSYYYKCIITGIRRWLNTPWMRFATNWQPTSFLGYRTPSSLYFHLPVSVHASIFLRMTWRYHFEFNIKYSMLLDDVIKFKLQSHHSQSNGSYWSSNSKKNLNICLFSKER